MSSSEKRFYEFGPFRFDPDQRLLWKEDKPVALQPKAFETLLLLVQHAGRVVLKEDLMKGVWGDTFVEEANLAQTIFVLRKALGQSGDQERYILTVPGRGYRFVGSVRTVPANEEGEKIGVAGPSEAQITPEEPRLPMSTHPIRARNVRIIVSVLVGLCLAVIAGAIFRPTIPPPKVSRIRQITQIGSLIHNTKLIIDGPRIYFRAWEGRERVIRYTSTTGGGEVAPVESPFPRMDIDDISPNGSEFLVVDLSSPDVPLLWRVPVSSGSPRPVGDLHTRDSRWSPDGRTIVYTKDSDLYLADSEGGHIRKLTSLPAEAIYPLWSPDGARLRFSIVDASTGGTTLWQADLATGKAGPLLPDWPSARHVLPGGWTPDGRYFFFTAWDGGTDDSNYDIWAIREQPEILRRVNPRAVQLTTGPLNFYQPTAGKDGKGIFAVGEHRRGELLRYDTISRSFVPYAQGRSADQVTFSRDARWIAYVEFPDGVLVRSRTDGSERRQLTFAPMRAYNPQWSPDGSQLAFEASSQPGAITKIYLIPRDGGMPVLATPDRADRQAYPSWSSLGNSILFTSWDASGSKLVLCSLDLNNRHTSTLPGTAGLGMGQMSPDGRQVAALSEPTHGLVLYEMASQQIRPLAELADYPHWSPDGAYVYFRTPYFGHTVRNPGIYRWIVSTNKVEKMFADPDFRLNGVRGVWSGLAPDGSLLVLRNISTADLYTLDLELP
jgi:DNA-binding winged helix-turn-helix (wHTH) protein/Tol biopolymer transport system component